jgi:YgiT-type zinc finger domain-containing protein
MKCVICQYGETEPGTTTVALTRDDTTIVIRGVPAQILAPPVVRNMWMQQRAGGFLRLQKQP